MTTCSYSLIIRDDTACVTFAADMLSAALQSKQVAVERVPHWLEANGDLLFIAGLIDDPQVSLLLDEESRRRAPTRAESFVRQYTRVGKRDAVVLVASDPRGLMYAILEEADDIQHATGNEVNVDQTGHTAVPHLRVRSAAISVMSETCDREWFYRQEFWDDYLTMLARSRFNRITLVLGHHTAYMSPPYSYFIPVPGFETVQVRGVDESRRAANLDILRYASRAANTRAVDFYLGIWQQQPWVDNQESLVLGLEPGDLASYCKRGITALLEACPDISGVQLRVNRESGVQDGADSFWGEFFKGISACRRRVQLDVRAKGMTDAVLDGALATGAPVTVSTKYWCEHMGLPYHPARQQSREFNAEMHELDLKRRYSYADLLKRPRPYGFLYRLWSFGSNRLLLWGDPGYASRFAKSCTLGDAGGFEVMGPLTAKGGLNQPESFPVTVDDSLSYCTWEHDKFWMYYLTFGRMGYDPETPRRVWLRELRTRFGPAAEAVEEAYVHAGRILPTLTAACLPSASAWGYWPEMQTGGTLQEYAAAEPSDPELFYSIEEYVADQLRDGPLKGKYTPEQVSTRLLTAAGHATAAAQKAEDLGDPDRNPELRTTVRDTRILAALGTFHAHKIRAAIEWCAFSHTQTPDHIQWGLEAAQKAANAWARIVSLTDGVYHDDLIFGRRPQHALHWKDRLREVTALVDQFKQLQETAASSDAAPERPPASPVGLTSMPNVLPQTLSHTPPAFRKPGNHLRIRLGAGYTALGNTATVELKYRAADQTKSWRSQTMDRNGEYFESVISAGAIEDGFDVLYFFVVRPHSGDPVLFPGLDSMRDGASMPYYVVRTTNVNVRT